MTDTIPRICATCARFDPPEGLEMLGECVSRRQRWTAPENRVVRVRPTPDNGCRLWKPRADGAREDSPA